MKTINRETKIASTIVMNVLIDSSEQNHSVNLINTIHSAKPITKFETIAKQFLNINVMP